MRPPLSYAPLLPVVTALTAGIICDRYVASITIILCVVIVGSVSLLLCKRTYPAVIAATVGVGIFCNKAHTPVGEIPDGERHTATVLRVTEATMSNRVIAQIKGYGNCYLSIPIRIAAPQEGDIIEFTALLTEPTRRKDIDTEYDLGSFYYRNYITSAGTATSCRVVGQSNSLQMKAARVRSKLTDLIVRSDINDMSKEYLTALLLGDRSLMPETEGKTMTKAGLAHILALSGLHVAILTFIFGLFLFPLAWGEINVPRYIILMVVLWAYAVVTGLSPSVTRAVVMLSIILIGKIIGRSGTTFNSLCFAVLVLIVANPRIIYAPGFQLTVSAVAAICLLTRLLPELNVRSQFKRAIIYWLIFTFSAVIGTLLLSIYYFHSFPTYFLLANVVAAIILPLLLGAGLLLMVISAAGASFPLLDSAIDMMCELINSTATMTGRLPGATVDNIYVPWWSVLLGYTMLVVLGCAIYYRKRALTTISASAIIVFFLLILPGSRSDELFIARTNEATTIVIADRNGIKAKTSAPAPADDDFVKALAGNYPNFFGLHHCDKAVKLTDGDSGNRWKSSGRIIATPVATIAVINDLGDNRPYDGDVTYAIICRGYKGDIASLTGTLRPDTVLLGTDIHPRRLIRFKKELEELGYPYRSLKDPYGLHLKF